MLILLNPQSIIIGLIGSFLIVVGVWTYHLYTLTGDKRKLMFSISSMISSISYWDLALEIFPEESFRKWTFLPIMFMIMIAANEPIVRNKYNIDTLFILFILTTIISAILIFTPLLFDPKYTSIIVILISTLITVEVFIVSIHQFAKLRNIRVLLFLLSIIFFMVGSISLRFWSTWVFIIMHIAAFFTLLILFINKRKVIDQNTKDLSSFFIIRQKLKETKDELERSELRLREVWNEAKDIIIWTDQETKKIIFANKYANKYLGYPENGLLGKIRDSIIDDSSSCLPSDIDKELIKSRRVSKEVILKTSKSRKIAAELNASLIDLRNERIVLEIYRDIQEKKEAELKIEDERRRAEFYLDLLSHDIGNLHQGIYTRLQLAENVKDVDKLHISISESEKLIKRSIVLVKNVKILAGLKNSKFDPAIMELNESVRSSVDVVKGIFNDRNVDIRFKPKDEPIWISVEPLVDQIFINILHNGIKFQKNDDPRVDIEIVKDLKNKTVQISFSDHGPGISEQMKGELFHQLRSNGIMTRRGLGLQMVKRLVDRYMGEVSVSDRIEGNSEKGVKFVIKFPIILDP